MSNQERDVYAIDQFRLRLIALSLLSSLRVPCFSSELQRVVKQNSKHPYEARLMPKLLRSLVLSTFLGYQKRPKFSLTSLFSF